MKALNRKHSTIFNRPGVAGAVLQTASWCVNSFTNSVCHPFPPNLQNIINPSLFELGTWNLKTRFPPSVCQVSNATFYMSHFTCHMTHVTKFVELIVEGSVINGAYPVNFLFKDTFFWWKQNPSEYSLVIVLQCHGTGFLLCHVSCMTHHISHITCHNFLLAKWWSLLVDGLVSTGSTASSFF